jgi:DNA-binding NtrC family response regulator
MRDTLRGGGHPGPLDRVYDCGMSGTLGSSGGLSVERILIVDDEVQVCRSLGRLFRREGFEVETAEGGPEALVMLDTFRPDVVLTDFRMPRMNGAQLLAEVRRRFPRTLRIILSGYSDLVSVMAPLQDGEISRFICKPWDNDTLAPVIRAMLTPSDARTARKDSTPTGERS